MVVAEVPGGVERLTRDMPLLAEFPTCQVLDLCSSFRTLSEPHLPLHSCAAKPFQLLLTQAIWEQRSVLSSLGWRLHI